MRYMIARLFAIACLIYYFGASCSSVLAAHNDRPNIVVIVADDLGYGELGVYGGDLPTPHLDQLARSGIRFTNGYVTAPFCAASRAALLTGRYQTRFGFEFNPIGAENADPSIGLPASEKSLAQAMRESGYATALIGKWHLGGTANYHPQRRGFDEFFGFLHEGHYYVPVPWSEHVTWLRRKTLPDGSPGRWISSDGRIIWSTQLKNFEPAYDADNPILRGGQPIAVSENLTDLFTAEAESFVIRHRDQPFFLSLTYNAVHSPMQAANRYLKQFGHIEDPQRRIFAAMLAHLDDGIGRLTKQLDNLRIRDRTLIFFLSDNGGPTRELTSRNHPLRGEKGTLYEGGIRVPFLMSWPDHLPAGRIENRVVSSLDIAATALSVAGGAKMPAAEGVDLIPFMSSENRDSIHQVLYWRVGAQAALRSGEWKLCRGRNPRDTWELYNLASDIGEERDLAMKEPNRLKELVAAWEKLDAEMVAPLWGGR